MATTPTPQGASGAPAARTLPLLEVAGLPADPRDDKLKALAATLLSDRSCVTCPFKPATSSGPARCTKDSRTSPVPVCSVPDPNAPTRAVVACPSRFHQGDVMFTRIAADLLPHPASGEQVSWVSEVNLDDAAGERLGRVDYVGAVHDASGSVRALVSVELQAVYTSGSSRAAFDELLAAAGDGRDFDTATLGSAYPTVDFLSSWKRIEYQVRTKGSALAAAGVPVRQALVVDRWFMDRIEARLGAPITTVTLADADFVFYPCELVLQDDGTRTLTATEPIPTTVKLLSKLLERTAVADVASFAARVESKLARR
jgi:hypothetical protein